jgi:hypothetical protein
LQLFLHLYNTKLPLDFQFGPPECAWNGAYKFHTKNPIHIIESIIQCDPSFDDATYQVNSRSRMSDIRSGTVYQVAQEEIKLKDPDARLIGLLLSVDDTVMTQFSGGQTGRPLYLSTTNQSLDSRRHLSTNAWRVAALLPTLRTKRKALNNIEKQWYTVANVEFVNRTMELALKPLIGNFFIITQKAISFAQFAVYFM